MPDPARQDVPLADLYVLDLSNTVAGQFAARLLSDHGATVVLSEPVGGSPTRTLQHVGADGKDHASLASFIHFNNGKIASDVDMDAVLDGWADPLGRDTWDVVITTSPDHHELAARRYPQAVQAIVTDFGPSGPYAHWQGTELVHQALSGSMLMNGTADGTPLYGAGHRASIAAAFELAIGITALAFDEARAGANAARTVEVTVHESAATMEQNLSTQWAYSRTLPQRGERFRPKGRLKCIDGYVVFFFVPDRYEIMLQTLGASSLLHDARFGDYSTFLANLTQDPDGMVEVLEAFTITAHVDELERAAGERGLMVAGVRTIQDLRRDDHLAARGFWRDVRCGGTTWQLPGPIADFSRSDIVGAQPRVLREDGLVNPSHESPLTSAARSSSRPAALAEGSTKAGLPLSGMRILDLTTAWAGPMATRLLGALGADVIKVEGPGRWDVWRGREAPYPPHQYPDSVTGDDPLNRNCWFNTQNHDKRSLVVDLKNPETLTYARELARQADVLIENYPDGTLDRLGLGYEDLRRLNPRLVVVHMSPYGTGGPFEAYRAFGPTMEALAGITGLIGYESQAPLGSGTAYMDPMGGLAAAFSTLVALRRAARFPEGQGEYIELCQREAALQWIGDCILAEQGGVFEAAPAGNRAGGLAPHGAYPTLGKDAWIAIAVDSETSWRSLCDELGLTDLHDDEDMSTLEGRRRAEAEIDRRIAAVTQQFGNRELAFRLQDRGVPAAPVANARDLFEDVHLRSRAWYQPVRHPTGNLVLEYPATPICIDGRRHHIGRHAPAFGQDSREVLRSLGVDDALIDAHIDAGMVAETRIDPAVPVGAGQIDMNRCTTSGPATSCLTRANRNQGDAA